MNYTFTRNAGPSDWVALPQQFKKADKIFEYAGHDYGCVRDDLMYGKVETVCCSLIDGEGPFFTVPCDWLIDESNFRPQCAYVRLSK